MSRQGRSGCEHLRTNLIAGSVGVQAIVLGVVVLALGSVLANTIAEVVFRQTAAVASGLAGEGTPELAAAVAAREIRHRFLVEGALGGLLVLCVTPLATALIARRYDKVIAAHARRLEEQVAARVRQSLSIRNALIFGLAKLADYRDTDTGRHLDRICEYSGMLAEELRTQFAEITPEWIEHLRLAASLHDIGKVGIPDVVLLKPGRFTPEERRLMETHAKIGAETLMAIRARLGSDTLVDMAIAIALGHHERWDGAGYPNRVAGEQNPLCARIVALADFYDAITSPRVYKPAMSHEEARLLIAQSRGTHFDPRIADAFERIHARFDETRGRLQAEHAPQRLAA